MAQSIPVSFHFFKDESRWTNEKPYNVVNGALDSIPMRNYSLEKEENISIIDIRTLEEKPSIETHGFQLIPVDTTMMRSEQYDEPQVIATVLLPKLAKAVKIATGASRIQFFDTTVRRRHPEFPKHTGASYKYLQPTSVPHIDCTRADAEEHLLMLNPDDGEEMLQRRWLSFNVWLPLKGPLRDYPLALLDARTVNVKKDLERADVVYEDIVHETYHVRYNSDHRWFFATDQMPSEGWLFVQASSGDGASIGVPHSSFDYPFKAHDDPLRESFECRGFALF